MFLIFPCDTFVDSSIRKTASLIVILLFHPSILWEFLLNSTHPWFHFQVSIIIFHGQSSKSSNIFCYILMVSTSWVLKLNNLASADWWYEEYTYRPLLPSWPPSCKPITNMKAYKDEQPLTISKVICIKCHTWWAAFNIYVVSYVISTIKSPCPY